MTVRAEFAAALHQSRAQDAPSTQTVPDAAPAPVGEYIAPALVVEYITPDPAVIHSVQQH